VKKILASGWDNYFINQNLKQKQVIIAYKYMTRVISCTYTHDEMSEAVLVQLTQTLAEDNIKSGIIILY
jgi:hypothetical protein